MLLFATFAYAGTVTRSFSSTSLETGENLTVTLFVDVTGETYYAVDEGIPSGWTISDAGSGSTGQPNHLKWANFSKTPIDDNVYVYVLTSTASGTSNFSGGYMFEGDSTQQTVAGQTQVTVSAPACAEGQITSTCTCGGVEYSDGYCCSGVWQDYACGSFPDCGEGQITSTCLCGGVEHDTGYCCSDVWQAGACLAPDCGEGQITSTCNCGGVDYDSGYCCSGVWQAGACPTPPDLVLWMMFDDDPSDGILDSSSYGNDGTCSTCPTVASGQGYDGSDAYSFNGTGSHVTVASPSGTEPTDLLTIAAWVNTNSIPDGTVVVVSQGDNYGLMIMTETNVRFFKHVSGAWNGVETTGQDVVDGTWHHLAAVQDATGMRIYIDGVETAQNTDTAPIVYDQATALEIGRYGNQGDSGSAENYDFAGLMDDVRIYDIALTQAEIQALVDQGGDCGGDTCTGTEICCSDTCIEPTCTVNADCGAGHICIDGGTCTATCEMGCETDNDCLPEQICCSGSCAVPTCSFDTDCDDLNVATLDICTGGGSCTASCSNTPITDCIHGDGYCPPTCDESTDGDCIATCGNFEVDPGENCGNCPIDVNCSGGQVCCNDACATPTCSTDAVCNDGDPCTTDTCNNPGLCTASCSNVSIAGCGGTTVPPGGDSPGGGSSAKLIVNVEGSCIQQLITVTILNERGNPVRGAEVRLVKNRKTIETIKTPETGKLTFTLEEEGEYIFYTTKSNYYSDSKKIYVKECAEPTVSFQQSIEIGQTQTITLIGGDGNAIRDFNVLLTYPDKTISLLKAKEGTITLSAEQTGSYTATVKTTSFETTVNFEATKPMQIVPDIRPGAKQVVKALLGRETVETPNYLIVWMLTIAVISGLIIQVTKLKPGWFRVFMATTYTTLPLVVNYYTQSILISFTTIAIQTTILTALWFQQWRIKKALEAAKNF